MKIKVAPNKLDGIFTVSAGETDDAIYYLAANSFGNRVKVVLPDGCDEIAAKVKGLLMTFNAKGTKFDLTEDSALLPIIAFCACYAFSDTEIIVSNPELAGAVAAAVNGAGGKAQFGGNTLKISGNAALKGGTVNAGGCLSVAKAAIFAATCADSPVSVLTDGKEKLDDGFLKRFSSFGGQIEVL